MLSEYNYRVIYLRLVSLFFLYKTLVNWVVFIKIHIGFFYSSVFLYNSDICQVISLMVCPIVAVSLWMITRWGVLLWFIALILDGILLLYTFPSCINYLSFFTDIGLFLLFVIFKYLLLRVKI